MKKLWWGGSWIVHQKERYQEILPFGPPIYDYHSIESSSLEDSEKGEIIRFLVTLELWERTPGTKIHTAQECWVQSLQRGPDYCEELSDLFALTWRENDIGSYNFCFPSRFLPRFEEQNNDLELSLEPTFADPDVLDEFREVLSNLLDEIPWEDVRFPNDLEIVYERSTNTSFLKDSKKTLPQWEASLNNTEFETKGLTGLRCKVPVYPGGTRDTVIADIKSNYSVRWNERYLRHILEYVPESADCLYSSTFNSRLQNVVHTKGWHVFRDMKKCGITYNVKDLFRVFREELQKRVPDQRTERFRIYEDLRFIDKDKNYTEFKTCRGYGLGMANHLVTLCNIVIHRMAIKVLEQQSSEGFEVRAIIGNDDCDINFTEPRKAKKIAKEYLEIEHDIHGRLGNMTNHKKSVVKDFGLFYEEYSKKGWENKEALVCNAIACAYLSPNIRVAKHYISSQSERFNSSWALHELKCLANFWGSEFYSVDIELKINYEIGGWLNTTSMCLKTTLVDLDILYAKGIYDHIIPVAYETCKQFINGPKPKFRTPGLVNNHLYTGPAKVSDQKVQLYTLVDDDIRQYYKEITTFQRNYKKKLMNYEKKIYTKNMLDHEGIQKDILSNNPHHSIPESGILYHGRLCDTWFDFESELYRYDDDPIATLLSGNDIDENDKVFTWDMPQPKDISRVRISSSKWQMLSASVYSNSGFLPTYEYFSRMGQNPVCRMALGRIRIPPEKVIGKISRGTLKHIYVFKVDKKEIYFDSHQEEDYLGNIDFSEPQVIDIFEVAREQFGIKHIPTVVVDEKVHDDLLDRLLADRDGRYDHTNKEEPETSLFDDDNDDPIDFGDMFT